MKPQLTKTTEEDKLVQKVAELESLDKEGKLSVNEKIKLAEMSSKLRWLGSK